jgi:predicted nucleic acid-binding protein
MRFWDSSAIIPLLVEESTTGSMTAYYRAQPEMVAWWGSTVECASALARLEREGHFDTASSTQAFRQLQSLHAVWNEIQPLDIVRTTAQRLLRVHPLRAADSLQLSAALVACDHRPQTWEFVCLDARLCAAAEREGFKVINNFV